MDLGLTSGGSKMPHHHHLTLAAFTAALWTGVMVFLALILVQGLQDHPSKATHGLYLILGGGLTLVTTVVHYLILEWAIIKHKEVNDELRP